MNALPLILNQVTRKSLYKRNYWVISFLPLSIVAVLIEIISIYTLSDLGDLSNNKQQQQNLTNKQIKLQRYCRQLARLFEAGQCVQFIEIKTKDIN